MKWIVVLLICGAAVWYVCELNQRAAEEKRLEDAAEQERIRRFAPEGIVYNLLPMSVAIPDGLTTISAGTELKILKQNPDNTLHVRVRDLEWNVASATVTNDRDLVRQAVHSEIAAQAETARKIALQEKEQQKRQQEAAAEATKAITRAQELMEARPASTPNPLDRGPH
jgi:hypothetical protein